MPRSLDRGEMATGKVSAGSRGEVKGSNDTCVAATRYCKRLFAAQWTQLDSNTSANSRLGARVLRTNQALTVLASLQPINTKYYSRAKHFKYCQNGSKMAGYGENGV